MKDIMRRIDELKDCVKRLRVCAVCRFWHTNGEGYWCSNPKSPANKINTERKDSCFYFLLSDEFK